ncbi:MAG: hypothetical protein KAU06_05920 [Candidatus Marinimicrobia bacterium]|nr:hypothetical protein [Candidatus Neomarinimicrobiota bacterium]
MISRKFHLVFVLSLLCIVFFMFCEQNYSTEPEAIVNASKSQVKPDNGYRVPCANRWYADRLFDATTNFSWDPCQDGNEQEIEGDDCAYLWAAFNPYWDEDLNSLACGESIPASLPSMPSFTKVTNERNPSMKWDFMWAHYHVIKRKIGVSGSWTTPYSYTVPLEAMQSAPDTTWTDTSINLLRFEDIVYYKIYGKVWTEESSTAPQIIWDNRPQK